MQSKRTYYVCRRRKHWALVWKVQHGLYVVVIIRVAIDQVASHVSQAVVETMEDTDTVRWGGFIFHGNK